MRSTVAKTCGSVIALLALGVAGLVGVRGQQPGKSPAPPALTTNWVGYLVAGQNDTLDRITPHPSPTIVRQVEIGLRSDGVVIWRDTKRR